MKTLIAAFAVLAFTAAGAEEAKKPAPKAAACEKDCCKDKKACDKKAEKKKACDQKECAKDAKDAKKG